MKKKRVLVLMDEALVPPDSVEGLSDDEFNLIKTEYNVCWALKELGHEVMPLGVRYDLSVIGKAIDEWKPHIAFNLLEEFQHSNVYRQYVIGYLELRGVKYTGCNPAGLLLSRDKAMQKKILSYHRMPVPKFQVFQIGRKVRRRRQLEFPLIVKSVSQEASIGISKASLVEDDAALAARVEFVHDRVGTDAIAEQFIPGREIYASLLGNTRIEILPIWELVFKNKAPDEPLINTEKAKFDLRYQEKKGIDIHKADIPEKLVKRIEVLSRRIYKRLHLSGYARLDYRLTPDGQPYLLEANPNPEIAYGEEFASAAEASGYDYPGLIQRIVNLGLRFRGSA